MSAFFQTENYGLSGNLSKRKSPKKWVIYPEESFKARWDLL